MQGPLVVRSLFFFFLSSRRLVMQADCDCPGTSYVAMALEGAFVGIGINMRAIGGVWRNLWQQTIKFSLLR